MESNLLLDPLPESVEVGGKDYAICTDFRTGILFSMAMEDAELSEPERLDIALSLYFPEMPPEPLEAVQKILWFYACGKTDTPGGSGKRAKDVCSFAHDAPYIYAAFLQQYRIDLNIESLHWWKFRALFDALSPDTLFMKIAGWRGAEIDSKMPDAERRRLQELKERYALPTAERRQTQAEEEAYRMLLEASRD